MKHTTKEEVVSEHYRFQLRLREAIPGEDLIRIIRDVIEDKRRSRPRRAKPFRAMASNPPAPKGVDGTSLQQVLPEHPDADLYRLMVKPLAPNVHYFEAGREYESIEVIGGLWTTPSSRIPPIAQDLVNALRAKLPV